MTFKHICMALTLGVLSLFTGIEEAEAKKRLGGGSNSGAQRQSVTPASPQAPAAAPAATPRNSAAPAAPAPGRNWMGIAGGLLTGALLGSLLFGSGGLGSMMGMLLNILIVGAIAFFVIRWWRNRSAGGGAMPALAGAGAGGGSMPMPSSPAPQSAPISERSATGRVAAPQIGSALGGAVSAQAVDAVAAQPVEQRIPADFDVAPFVREAKKAFMMLQAANDRGDVTTLRNFLTPELANELAPDIMKNAGGNQRVEVVTLDATVLEVVQDPPGRWIASVHFSGQIREEAGQPAEAFDEVWHVTKPTQGGQWLVAGIQQIEGTTHAAGSASAGGFGHQPGAH